MEVFDAHYVPLTTMNFYNVAAEQLTRLATLATDGPPPVLGPEVVRRVS